MLVMYWKIVWLHFEMLAFLHLPSDWGWHICCISGLTKNKLECRQGKNKELRIEISHHG